MIYWFAWVIWKGISALFFPRTIRGKENITLSGPFIIASNHLSNLDPMIIGLCFNRKLSYVAKDSLFKNNIFAFFLHKVGAFPIKRDSSDFRALRETLRRLKAGCPVVVFPEGTRQKSKEATQKKAPAGIGFMVAKSGLPVLPVYIKGSDKTMPPGAKGLKRHPVTVTFGAPLNFSKGQDFHAISGEIMKKINVLKA